MFYKYLFLSLAVIPLACSFSVFASESRTFSIHLQHVLLNGTSEPFVGKEVGFNELVTTPKVNQLGPNYTHSDEQGAAQLSSGNYSTFVRRVNFCAKLDGPWYCADNSDLESTGSVLMKAHSMFHGDLKDSAYICTAAEIYGQPDTHISVVCSDRTQ